MFADKTLTKGVNLLSFKRKKKLLNKKHYLKLDSLKSFVYSLK